MYGLLLVLHLLVCLGLIGVVLIQSGKGGGLAGGAFGGSAQTVFGGRGANDIVTRATMILGGLFFITSVTLALISTGQRGTSRSLMQQEAQKASSSAGQQPGAAGRAPARGTPAGGTPAPGQAPAPATAPSSGAPAPTPSTPPTSGK